MTSYALLALVRDGSGHKGTAHHLLLTIATYADPDGSGARPGMQTLASVTGIPERTVYRLIERLVRSGELVLEQGRGRGRANTYRLNVAQLRAQLAHKPGHGGPAPEDLPTAADNLPNGPPRTAEVAGFGPDDLPITCQTAPEDLPTAADNLPNGPGKPATWAQPVNRVRDRVTGDREPDRDPAAARAREGWAEFIVIVRDLPGLEDLDAHGEQIVAGAALHWPRVDLAAEGFKLAAEATKYAAGDPNGVWSVSRVVKWIERAANGRPARGSPGDASPGDPARGTDGQASDGHRGGRDDRRARVGTTFAGFSRRSDQLN